MARVKLADTSAWNRARHPEIAEVWRGALMREEIATTQIVQLEILYSARSATEYDSLLASLEGIHQLPCDGTAAQRALEVHRLLAHRGGLQHRIPTPDLLIAAVAEIHGATVWHYDQDFDRIAEVTGQPMEWVAPRGSL